MFWSLVNHKWLFQGWTQTSINLQVVYSTRHFFLSLLNHRSNYNPSFWNIKPETKEKKKNMFWSLFISREHSTQEPACSRVTYFILRAYTGNLWRPISWESRALSIADKYIHLKHTHTHTHTHTRTDTNCMQWHIPHAHTHTEKTQAYLSWVWWKQKKKMINQ